MSNTHREHHICWGGGCDHRGGHSLQVEQLCAGYGALDALSNLSFSIDCGHTLALIGPNGAGKSTLLNVLAGLLRPRKGRILWNGAPLMDNRHEIAYVPQRSEVNRNFPLTVRGLVEMGRYPSLGVWRAAKQHDHDIVERAIDALGLRELSRRQISELSGGQQQRAFLARALAQEAHIMLLDEPFTGLDLPGSESLGEMLRALAAEGRLIIASHHDLITAPKIFDYSLLLHRKLISFGKTEDSLRAEHLQAAFGYIPHTLQA